MGPRNVGEEISRSAEEPDVAPDERTRLRFPAWVSGRLQVYSELRSTQGAGTSMKPVCEAHSSVLPGAEHQAGPRNKREQARLARKAQTVPGEGYVRPTFPRVLNAQAQAYSVVAKKNRREKQNSLERILMNRGQCTGEKPQKG